MKSHFLAALLAAACPVAALAGDLPPHPTAAGAVTSVPAAKAVTLRLKFTPGQTRRYKTIMVINTKMMTGQSGAAIPTNMVITMTMLQTVKNVRPADGAATIVSTIETMKTVMNGKEITLPETQSATMKKPTSMVMLPTGKILSVESAALAGGAMPGMDLNSALKTGIAFPDLPVKIGDLWNGTAEIGGIKMQYGSTLAGTDTFNGADRAMINQTLNGDINMKVQKNVPVSMNMTGKMTGGGSQIFDVTAGEIASQKMETNMDVLMRFTPPAGSDAPAGMPPAMKMVMTQTLTMERIDDATPSTTLLK